MAKKKRKARHVIGVGICLKCEVIQVIFEPLPNLALFKNQPIITPQNCIGKTCGGHIKDFDDELPF